jgi:hypothetical protein
VSSRLDERGGTENYGYMKTVMKASQLITRIFYQKPTQKVLGSSVVANQVKVRIDVFVHKALTLKELGCSVVAYQTGDSDYV